MLAEPCRATCWRFLSYCLLVLSLTMAPQYVPCCHPDFSFIPKTFLATKSANPYSFPHLSVGQMKSLLCQAQVLSYSHFGKQSVSHFSLHCLITLGVGARGCRGASAHTDNATCTVHTRHGHEAASARKGKQAHILATELKENVKPLGRTQELGEGQLHLSQESVMESNPFFTEKGS